MMRCNCRPRADNLIFLSQMSQPVNAEGKIAIVGGGPAGACMALILAQRGFSVDVFELRADPRKSYTKVDGGCVSLSLFFSAASSPPTNLF